MALYVYLKTVPKPKREFHLSKKTIRLASFTLTILGFILLSIVALPIGYYQLILGPRLTKQEILRPIPVVKAVEEDNGLVSTDYTKANTWFPKALPQIVENVPVLSYTLSIPDLSIKDATVIIGAEDLNKSLIHYGGTALPGQLGNAVIFGHSILPIFYDPKSYKAIFSTLPTLKKGAKIYVNYDGVEYVYQVFEQEIVGPDDVSVLAQRYDNSYLTLITCYPPGTYWKRIVVGATLVKPE